MFIQTLRLKNGYKRFHDLTIELGESPARIVALVGPNGCGKSSVFDGILFRHNSYMKLGGTKKPDSLYHSLYQKGNYSFENIEILFSKGTYDEIYHRRGEANTANMIFSFRSSYRYNSTVKISNTQAVPEIRLNNYGASSADALDSKMEMNYRRIQVIYNKYLLTHDVRPSEARTHLIGELNSYLGDCLDLEIDNLGDVASNRGTIYFTKPDQPTPFEYNVLSSGEKEVVDLLLDLYLRKDEYDDTVFMLDEPELHINASVQKKLLVAVDKMVGVDCQIWVATHSIGLLRALQDDLREKCQVIHFKPNADFAASSHVLTPIGGTRRDWLEIFKTALDDLAHLISPKRIIFCEGKAETRSGEECGLDAQVYNNIFGGTHTDTLFVSSGGNTEPHQRSEIAFTILTKAVKDVEIFVLVDRDFSSGMATSQKDREVYLKTNPNNHRALDRWEIENYLYDVEILRSFCEENELTFDEDQYQKHVVNIIDDHVKDMTGTIKKVCGVTWSISAQRFKLQLSKHIRPGTSVYQKLEDCIFP